MIVREPHGAVSKKGQVRVKRKFFPELAGHWNRLPSASLIEFKKHLDNALRHMA